MALSTDELKRWCRQHIKRGMGKYAGDKNREFSHNAFCRAIGVSTANFAHWMSGRWKLPVNTLRNIERFAAQWDAGLISFTPFNHRDKRKLIYHDKPVRRRTRMAVDFSQGAPRVILRGNPVPEPVMPTFKELLRPKLTK